MTIRDGVPSDAPCLRDQLVMIQELHRSAYPEIYRPIDPTAAEEFMLQRLQERHCFVRVAEIGGAEVVGHAVSEIQERSAFLFKHAQSVLYLSQIFVTPRYRKRGVGRRLVADAIEIARTHAVARVELNVWEFEGNARRFFSRSGFRDFGYQMVHAVTEAR